MCLRQRAITGTEWCVGSGLKALRVQTLTPAPKQALLSEHHLCCCLPNSIGDAPQTGVGQLGL